MKLPQNPKWNGPEPTRSLAFLNLIYFHYWWRNNRTHSQVSNMLTIKNHGPLIAASNFWGTEAAAHGLLYLSINAGAFRLLVPETQHKAISEMRAGAKYAVVSMLQQDRWRDGQYVVEWMIEDGSNSPWSCHLSPAQLDRAPGACDVSKGWIASVWNLENNQPHKCLELPAYYQIVPNLPWLKKIEIPQ
jgi:hypothetical protein